MVLRGQVVVHHAVRVEALELREVAQHVERVQVDEDVVVAVRRHVVAVDEVHRIQLHHRVGQHVHVMHRLNYRWCLKRIISLLRVMWTQNFFN